NYLKIFAFRNSETILEQVGTILCLLEKNQINPDIDYYKFEILFKKEIEHIFENKNEVLIQTEISFKIPSPIILKKTLSFLEIILKNKNKNEVFLMLIECYKREKKVKKNRGATRFVMKSYDMLKVA
ncbi:MAG: hypothetical protein ACRCZ9_06535, partial [Fusobacteriaceae bacterium]